MIPQDSSIQVTHDAATEIDYARFCQNLQQMMQGQVTPPEPVTAAPQQGLRMGQELLQVVIQRRKSPSSNVFQISYNGTVGELHLYDTDKSLCDRLAPGTVIEHATVVYTAPDDKRLILVSGNMLADKQTISQQLEQWSHQCKVVRITTATTGLCWIGFNLIAAFDCRDCPLPVDNGRYPKVNKVCIDGIAVSDERDRTCILRASRLDCSDQ